MIKINLLKKSKNFFFLLGDHNKKFFLFLIVLNTIQSFLEVSGAASVIPLMLLLIDKNAILENNFLLHINSFVSNNSFLSNYDFYNVLLCGVLILTTLLLSLRILATWFRASFIESVKVSISKRLLESYLSQSYSFHIKQQVSDLSKMIISEVDSITTKFVQPIVIAINSAIIGIALLIFLFYLNIYITTLVILFCFLIYLIFYIFFSSKLYQIGVDKFINNKKRFILINEIFEFYKVIKINSIEKFFMDKFNYANYLFNSTNKVRQTISELPSHISEFVMIFVLLLILFYLINIGDVHSSYNITLAGVFGYTFLKLKPIYSNIFNVFVGLKYSKRALDRVMYDLSINKNFKKSRQPSMSFKKEIIFNNVSFSFKNRNKIFSNLNLKIKKKSIFGIKGKSGSGKTTLINLLIGLLKPDIGNIYIDNINLLNSNASNFHKIIGFAPQETFILNSSIKENIALGTDTHNISDKSINNLINIVCLDNFLKNNFGGDLNKSIGDKGIKISGGERQRIGIARALFRNPDILILDEATSGIDINTEAKILKNILTHFPLITVIIISHRHSSLKNCTEILDLGFI